MDSKKLIILYWASFDNRVKTLFDLPYLLERGVEIEYWDVSAITIKEYKIRECPVLSGIEHKKINDKKHFIFEVKKVRSEDAIFLVFMNYGSVSYFCFRTLSKYRCSMMYCINGIMPQLSGKERLRYRLVNIFSHRLWRTLKERWYLLLEKTILIRPVDVLLKCCEKSTHYGNCKIGNKTKNININSGDFQMAKFSPFNNNLIPDYNFLVFIDQNLPFHPDNTIHNIRLDSKEYFDAMNKIFDALEKKYSTKIVIAAHPSASSRYLKEDFFNGREVIPNKTMELVKFSEGVITHGSTAVSYPIIFEKRMMYVSTKAMCKSINGLHDKLCLRASIIGCPYIKSEDGLDLPDDWNMNTELYHRYLYSYLCNEDSENTPNGEIIFNVLRNSINSL